jgi:sugar phosphate isomerase/epimerase
MQTHWSAHLTLSIVHFMAYPETMKGEGPIVETIGRIAEDAFFGGIELGMVKDPAARAEVKAILAATGIRTAFAAQPALLMGRLDLNAADPAMRAHAIDALKSCIDQAAELGIPRLATLSGWDPGEALRPQAIDWLCTSLSQVCAYGRDHGVGITLETFDRTIDKKALIGPAGEAAALSARLRRQFADFGLMYDLSHLPLLDEEIGSALVAVKDHLVHVHVGNCVKVPGRQAYGDQHPRFGFPGGESGVDELVAFLRGLFAIGYLSESPAVARPWVGIEVKPQPGETSAQLLANTKRAWTEAWARV